MVGGFPAWGCGDTRWWCWGWGTVVVMKGEGEIDFLLGYNKFYTKSGQHGLSPPWGVINAIDLNTGEYKWKQPFGENQFPGAPANTGCENYGGPIVTKGGLLIVGATKDGMFRAYNKNTGKLLWQTKLPAAAFSTPSTYEVNGKQYIVIACGGGKLGTKSGDSYVAFALPDKGQSAGK